MRITKQIATDVADKLVASKRAELKELKNQEAEYITAIYEATLSDLIMQTFKKHKGFLYSTNSIGLSGAGLSQGYKSYPLSKELPKCNSCGKLPVTDEQAAIIVKFENQYEDRRKEFEELFTSIEIALINLRTYKNVEKEFPEAFKLLPPTAVNTSLMVNLKDIRCQLDKANC